MPSFNGMMYSEREAGLIAVRMIARGLDPDAIAAKLNHPIEQVQRWIEIGKACTSKCQVPPFECNGCALDENEKVD